MLEAQRQIRDEIERNPSRYLLRELTEIVVGAPTGRQPRLRAAADAVGEFLGVPGDDLAFVDNTTTGANAILRSLEFAPGDEIVVSDFGYGGVTRAVTFAARKHGAIVRTVEMPYPITSAEEVVSAFVDALGPKTRLAVVDHITSQSALILPLAAIAAACRERGIAVLADGAHAPGAVALDIPSLGVDWYVGNLHKWMWVPRSSGILWTSPARQKSLHAAVISWGLDCGFHAEFDLPGTRDPSPHLSAPAAIAFMRELGVDAVRGYNHALAWEGARLLADRWGTDFSTPESFIGTMATVALPPALGSSARRCIAAAGYAAARRAHRGAAAFVPRQAVRQDLRPDLQRDVGHRTTGGCGVGPGPRLTSKITAEHAEDAEKLLRVFLVRWILRSGACAPTSRQ